MLRSSLLALLIGLFCAQAAQAQNFPDTQNIQDQAWSDTAEPAAVQSTAAANARQPAKLPDLPVTATGMPFAHSFIAPANLALQQQGLTELPKTSLAPLANAGAEEVLGDEGNIYNEFGEIHRLDRLIPDSLTTGHKSDAPPAWGFTDY
jgi:hypothetical protein